MMRTATVYGRISLVIAISFAIGLVAVASVNAQLLQVHGDLTPGLHVIPGGSYERSLIVTNSSSTAQTVSVYLLDKEYLDTGNTKYHEPGSLIRSLAPWVMIDTPEFSLQPGETRVVHYRVNVPNDPSFYGTFWTTMLIEGSSTVTEASEDEGEFKESQQDDTFVFGLRLRVRHAVTIRATFPDQGERNFGFGNPTLDVSTEGADNDSVLSFMLINRGDAEARGISISADVYDAMGRHVTVASGEVSHLIPGEARPVNLSLGTLTPGDYQTIVFADVGDGDIFGARYTLKVNP